MAVRQAKKPIRLNAGRLKRIHVNQHNIRANIQSGQDLPVITVKHGADSVYGHSAQIVDEAGKVVAEVVYPTKPLACGARVWIQTSLTVRVTGRTGKAASCGIN